MEIKWYCVHQMCRPSAETITGMNINGRGNCFICTPHEDNQNCTHYHKVVVGIRHEEEEE